MIFEYAICTKVGIVVKCSNGRFWILTDQGPRSLSKWAVSRLLV